MGCGQSNRSEVRVPAGHVDKAGDRGPDHEHRPKPMLEHHKKDREKQYATEDKKEVKDIGGIVIEPSQFVLEHSESIYKNYSLREKLGEGIV